MDLIQEGNLGLMRVLISLNMKEDLNFLHMQHGGFVKESQDQLLIPEEQLEFRFI